MADIKITTYGNMVERCRNTTANAMNLIQERTETRTQDSLPENKGRESKEIHYVRTNIFIGEKRKEGKKKRERKEV